MPLILALKSQLTDAGTISRQRSFLLLSIVIKRLPTLNITKEEIEHIIDFCVLRLKDYSCEGEILLCFGSLYQSRSQLITTTKNEEILEGIFTSVNLQSHPQNIRQCTLEMLNSIINSSKMRIKKENEDNFVQGYLKFVEDEKDPRCLLLSFSMFVKICQLFDYNIISHYSMELFDIVSCYFPIEFTRPKNDIHGITSDELRDLLLKCFSCHSCLSVHTLPFLLEKIEKLEECNKTTEKYDIINALNVCCQKYGLTIVQSYLTSLYNKLKAQILYGNDETLNIDSESSSQVVSTVDACIEVIVTMVKLVCDWEEQKKCKKASFNWGSQNQKSKENDETANVETMEIVSVADTTDLSNDSENKSNENEEKSNDESSSDKIDTMRSVGWPTLLQPLIEDFKDELKIPDAKLARIFCKIIIGAMSANEIAFDVFSKHLWNEIEEKYRLCLNNLNKHSSQHQALLDLIVRCIMLVRNLNCKCKTRIKSMYQVLIDTLKIEKDNNAMDTNCVIFVALSFVIDSEKCDYLTKDEIEIVISKIYQSYQYCKDINKEHSRIIFDALNRIGIKYYVCVMQKFIEPLAIECKMIKCDNNNNSNNNNNSTTCKNLHEFLSGVSALILNDKEDFLLNLAIDHLSSLIKDFLIAKNNSNNINEKRNEFVNLMKCMNIVGNMISVDKKQIGTKVTQKIVQSLIVDFCQESFKVSKDIHDAMLDKLCLMICFIVSRVLNHSKLSDDEQEMKQLIDKLISMSLGFKMGSDSGGDDTRSIPQYKLLIILVSLSSIPMKFVQTTSNGKLLTQLQILIFSLSNKISNEKIIYYYLQCFASLLNKSDVKNVIIPFMSSNMFVSLKNKVESLASRDKEKGNKNKNKDENVLLIVHYIIYIMKALIMRCYNNNMNQLIEYFCCLLFFDNGNDNSTNISLTVAKGFDIIMTESKLLLNKHIGCRVSLLFQQKFFEEVIPILLKLLNSKRDISSQVSPLLSLSYMMQNVSNSVLSRHLKNLLPLMVRSLCSNIDSIKVSSVLSFEILLNDNIDCIVPHLHSVIPQFINLCSYKSSHKVRIAAINCLTRLTKIEENHKIQPFKRQIIQGLIKPLDDPTKDVRQHAVACRNQWFLAG